MAFLLSLADIRDVFIIIYGTAGIVAFVAFTVITVIIGLNIKKLVVNVNGMVDETVKPTLASVKEAAETFTGTTEFVGNTTIRPIVKAYGVFAGMKRAAGVASAIGGRRGK